MIIPELGEGLVSRQSFSSCPSGYTLRNGRCYQSNWSYWGRWVLAAIVIVFFLVLFLTWSCISNRRRRRAGMNPRYGTGWMMPGQQYGNGQQPQYGNGWFGQNKYNNNQQPQYQQPPPPQYTPANGPVPNQYTGQTFNSNEGYYGQHNNNNDIPLQQPGSSYYPRGGDNVYEPPTGPPPAKS
ncbi:Protein RCR2 [Diaporthe amygdali]|uniref:Protein RCR2 n=1 Tax=Phomopsis amygdali TaxID=1214568 RepID=UPI0022FE27D6|nr:Protein RCR2 [Diaporthe amygdali]KAJ0121636.1 Protein RCR2 [Diaporthe amygdali]